MIDHSTIILVEQEDDLETTQNVMLDQLLSDCRRNTRLYR